MSNKLLAIVGPTATGKTSLAISLSIKFSGTLISADSRQVYRGMDIVTGKDHDPGITLQGIDIVNPDEECSVAVWHDSVSKYLSQSSLAIVVGGTGLWVKALTDGIETMNVPRDEGLRSKLEVLTVLDLQRILRNLDNEKFTSMNQSDVNNPRRLIRAIEILKANSIPQNTSSIPLNSKIIALYYGDQAIYEQVVRSRVVQRIEQGAITETRNIIASYGTSFASLSAIGYRSIMSFIEGNLSEQDLIEVWTRDELNYAKRQLTWFRKIPNIDWFDVNSDNYLAKIESAVQEWYDKK